jgi:hypothetical protein
MVRVSSKTSTSYKVQILHTTTYNYNLQYNVQYNDIEKVSEGKVLTHDMYYCVNTTGY